MLKQVYRLKVSLREIRPAVWRRLEVPADLSLGQLHRVLQAAMGWTDSHLHQFVHAGALYGRPDRELQLENEQRVRLGSLLRVPRDQLVYEYDFGDGWEHDVVLEAVGAPSPGARYPRVLAGARACPPEDVGGPYGYRHFLEALANARHPRHKEYAEWCGGYFDPAAFDLAAANRALAPRARRRVSNQEHR